MSARGLRALERRLVIVHVPHGPSLRGLLVAADRDTLTLANAHHLDQGAPLGGEVLVLRQPGVWVQTVVQEEPK